jgi:hypothetical protein
LLPTGKRGWDDKGRSLENLDDIDKIKTGLLEVGAAFSFIPFKTHAINVYN